MRVTTEVELRAAVAQFRPGPTSKHLRLRLHQHHHVGAIAELD
jgi:hypothetical protein